MDFGQVICYPHTNREALPRGMNIFCLCHWDDPGINRTKGT
jgi:hypothetical protein